MPAGKKEADARLFFAVCFAAFDRLVYFASAVCCCSKLFCAYRRWME
jgi:hypothetical protein